MNNRRWGIPFITAATGFAVGCLVGFSWPENASPDMPVESKMAVGDEPAVDDPTQSEMVDEHALDGLVLVGTTIFPNPSKSMAWVLSPVEGIARMFRVGDVIAAGFRVESIEATQLVAANGAHAVTLQRSAADSTTDAVGETDASLTEEEAAAMTMRVMLEETRRFIEEAQQRKAARRAEEAARSTSDSN